jgi:hypothetical protein
MAPDLSQFEIVPSAPIPEPIIGAPDLSQFEIVPSAPVAQMTPANPYRIATGGLGNILNALTFGYGNEIAGVGAGALDYLGNKISRTFGGTEAPISYADAVTQRENQMAQMRSEFNQLNTPAALATNVLPAFINPISAVKAVQAAPGLSTIYEGSKLAKALVPAVDVAAQTALTASGEAPSGERLQAATQALTEPSTLIAAGGIGGLSGLSQFAEPLAKRFYAAGMGISQKNVKNIPGKASETIDTLRKEGMFSKGFDPEDIKSVLINQRKELGAELGDLLKEADSSKITDLPEFSSVRKLVESKQGGSYTSANKMYQRELNGLIDDFAARGEGGTLADWQKAKVSLQTEAEKAYSQNKATVRDEVKMAMASDIRDYIEKSVNKNIPEMSGEVSKLNQALGMRKSMLPVLERAIEAEQAAKPYQSLLNAVKTTGGLGTLYLGSKYDGEDGLATPLLTALGGALLTKKGNFITGDLLRQIPKATSTLPQVISRSLNYPNDEQRAGLENTQETLPQNSLVDQSLQNDNIIEAKPIEKAADFPQLKAVEGVTKKEVAALIDEQPPFIKAIIQAESAGNSKAVSKVGAQGLMQIMPDTAKDLGLKNAFDPKENIAAGTKYIAQLEDKYKDKALALAAYNWGPARVDSALRRAEKKGLGKGLEGIYEMLPAETKNYILKIAKIYNQSIKV